MKNERRQAQHQVEHVLAGLNCTGAPWNRRNLYLPDSLPKAITEPLKVMAPMAAPRNSSSRLPPGMAHRPWRDAEGPGLGHGGDGDEHRRQADHAVHERHQLGHLGHLDRLAMIAPAGAADQQAQQHPAQPATGFFEPPA
jgi:hypothetical protein